jgi:hypothetical protein
MCVNRLLQKEWQFFVGDFVKELRQGTVVAPALRALGG